MTGTFLRTITVIARLKLAVALQKRNNKLLAAKTAASTGGGTKEKAALTRVSGRYDTAGTRGNTMGGGYKRITPYRVDAWVGEI